MLNQTDKITYSMVISKMLNESVLDTLRKIVKDKQASKVKFKNGKMMNIDMQTANMIVKSFEKRIKKDDIKKLSEILGSMGIIAILTANPLMGISVIICTGYSYVKKQK